MGFDPNFLCDRADCLRHTFGKLLLGFHVAHYFRTGHITRKCSRSYSVFCDGAVQFRNPVAHMLELFGVPEARPITGFVEVGVEIRPSSG